MLWKLLAKLSNDLLSLIDDFGEVQDASFGVRILEQNSGNVLVREVHFEHVGHFDLDAKWKSSCFHATYRLRVKFIGENKPLSLILPWKMELFQNTTLLFLTILKQKQKL